MPSWRSYLIWPSDLGGEHNTLDMQNTLIIYISATADAIDFLSRR